MKKKIVIPIIILLVSVIGIIGFILWNNRIVSTITLDINPSIEINLNKNNKIKKIQALNDDAKEIITNDLKDKTLEETFNLLIINLIDKGYVDNNSIEVILYTNGKITKEEVAKQIEFEFGKENVHTEVIIIKNITNEDKKIAKKYNISPAKASYINSINKENNNIMIENLINKPVKELRETKDTGNYCNSEYMLEGDFCLKEIDRVEANPGKVCKEGYYEYNGKCYEEVPSIEENNLLCPNEFTLNDTKCTRTIIINATPSKFSCEKGESKTRLELNLTNDNSGDANDIVCVDYSNATHPVTPCELPASDPTERTFSGGKCYWHKAPVIQEGCPGKIQVDGFCWDDASNIYICAGYRDGKQYKSKSEYCEHSIKYIDPTVTEYTCPKDYTLNGNKCEKQEIDDPMHERTCPNNYTLVNNDRCINYNKISEKVDGFVCDKENTKLKENTCIIYDIVAASHSN